MQAHIEDEEILIDLEMSQHNEQNKLKDQQQSKQYKKKQKIEEIDPYQGMNKPIKFSLKEELMIKKSNILFKFICFVLTVVTLMFLAQKIQFFIQLSPVYSKCQLNKLFYKCEPKQYFFGNLCVEKCPNDYVFTTEQMCFPISSLQGKRKVIYQIYNNEEIQILGQLYVPFLIDQEQAMEQNLKYPLLIILPGIRDNFNNFFIDLKGFDLMNEIQIAALTLSLEKQIYQKTQKEIFDIIKKQIQDIRINYPPIEKVIDFSQIYFLGFDTSAYLIEWADLNLDLNEFFFNELKILGNILINPLILMDNASYEKICFLNQTHYNNNQMFHQDSLIFEQNKNLPNKQFQLIFSNENEQIYSNIPSYYNKKIETLKNNRNLRQLISTDYSDEQQSQTLSQIVLPNLQSFIGLQKKYINIYS